jgi:hypothetical protein
LISSVIERHRKEKMSIGLEAAEVAALLALGPGCGSG